MRILWDNIYDNLITNPSSAKGNFPIDNTKDPRLCKTWQSLSATGQWIVVDAGEGNTIAPNYAVIAGHNLTSGSTIKIQSNDTDEWDTPAESLDFVWDGGPMAVDLSGNDYRFLRFYFDDPSNTDNCISIGRLFLGDFLQMPDIEPDPEFVDKSNSIKRYSPSNQVYGDKGYQAQGFQFTFPFVSHTLRNQIRAMWKVVDIVTPVFLIIWEDSLDLQGPLYVTLDQDEIRWKKIAEEGVNYSTELTFKECN